MAAQKGSGVIVSIKDDEASPAYQVVGGLRSRSISFNNEMVDITSASSTGLWRELLSGGGVRSASLAGAFTFYDDTAAAEVKDAFFNNEVRDMKFEIPDFGVFEGPFLITSLEYSADYNAEVAQSCSFESAGVITFT
jgi:TP901-1 family phage major tail protein